PARPATTLALRDALPILRARFLSRPLDADGIALTFDEHTLARAAAKYGAALAHTAGLHRVLAATGAPYELELSVDETSYPTTPEDRKSTRLNSSHVKSSY